MNVEDARAALESKTRITAGSRSQHTEVMVAADAYVKAAKLGVIDEILSEGYSPEQIEDMRRNIEEGVYCPDAPVKEVTHDV